MSRKLKSPYLVPEASILWAIQHIHRFGDTDILPISADYKAIKADAARIAAELSKVDLFEHYTKVPRRIAVPKAHGGFRVGSQLAPDDGILFTGLAHKIAPNIEAARMSSSEGSCSYRIDIQNNGQFFAPGLGYDAFNLATESNLRNEDVRFVLAVDLADFYNQISHHRIANNMASAGLLPADCEAAEEFLNKLGSNHHSRGLPIGPTASVIFAEVASLDIDHFIRDKGVKFCRYVDDFRFFFRDQTSAQSFLADFTEMLFANHRLATNTSKTKLWNKDSYGSEIVDGDALEEERKQEHLMKIIRSRSESCEPPIGVEPSELDENEATRRAIDELFQRVEQSEPISVGLAKFVLKRACALKTTKFARRLLENLEHFWPVVGDVVEYALSVDRQNQIGLLGGVFEWLRKDSCISQTPFMREWTGHLASLAPQLFPTWDWVEMAYSQLPQAITARYLPLTAARKNNWGFIRQLKEKIDDHHDSAQRSIVLASCVLAEDEKRHWLGRFHNSSDVILGACVAYARNNKAV